MELRALFLLAFLPFSQALSHLQPADIPDPALYRRHLMYERQAPCFNDLATGQPQSCIASASCCRGVRYSTCVRNGDVCCDFVNSMGSCPAGYTCQQNGSGEPSCEPPSSGGGGGGGGGNGGNKDDDGDDEKEEDDTESTSSEVVSSTSSSQESATTSFEPFSTSSDIVADSTTTESKEPEKASATATTSETSNDHSGSGSNTLTQAKLVGIVISIIAAVCGIVFGIVRLVMNHKKHKRAQEMRQLY